MTTDEAYMLGRNQAESERLDAQHNFSRSLAHGKLIQPSISQSGLLRIADVGTGTGIWIREAATEVAASNAETKFSGFDISAQQFPGDEIPGVEFIKHDAVQPFPQRYHERFDLVHVRLLSYAIKAQDLDMTVRNIVQIISKIMRSCILAGICTDNSFVTIKSLEASSSGKNLMLLIAGLCLIRKMRDLQSHT